MAFHCHARNCRTAKLRKTSLVDEDVTTLLYREAENALMDAAVLYLPSREVVTSPKLLEWMKEMSVDDQISILSFVGWSGIIYLLSGFCCRILL